MFGKNIIMKVQRSETGALDVHSVFYTLQGEGPFAGWPAVFVRLHGCSLACSWCDTEFEAKCKTYEPVALLKEVMAMYLSVASPGARMKPLIVITGGEPTRQRLGPFVHLMLSSGYSVQIETAGIHWDDELWQQRPAADDGMPFLSFVCSPKTPKVHENIARVALAFKYIIDAREWFDPDDGLPELAVSQRNQAQHGRLYRPPWLSGDPGRVFVQPLDPDPAKANESRCVVLAMRFGYKLSLQQHKRLGLE